MDNKQASKIIQDYKNGKDIPHNDLFGAFDLAIESLKNAEIDNKIIKTQHDRIQELLAEDKADKE